MLIYTLVDCKCNSRNKLSTCVSHQRLSSASPTSISSSAVHAAIVVFDHRQPLIMHKFIFACARRVSCVAAGWKDKILFAYNYRTRDIFISARAHNTICGACRIKYEISINTQKVEICMPWRERRTGWANSHLRLVYMRSSLMKTINFNQAGAMER